MIEQLQMKVDANDVISLSLFVPVLIVDVILLLILMLKCTRQVCAMLVILSVK